jgi:hypothetical protein
VVVLARDGACQRDLGCVAKRSVSGGAAGKEALGLNGAPRSGRDSAKSQPRFANGVAVEIENDGR